MEIGPAEAGGEEGVGDDREAGEKESEGSARAEVAEGGLGTEVPEPTACSRTTEKGEDSDSSSCKESRSTICRSSATSLSRAETRPAKLIN